MTAVDPGGTPVPARDSVPAAEGSFPKALIAGTVLFALLSAGIVAALIYFGESRSRSNAESLEDQAISVSEEELLK